MNFYIIRYFILLISLLILIFATGKRIFKLTKTKLSLIIVIFYILCWMPYESLFINFTNPAKAFNYSFPNHEICKTLEKDDYAFFLYKKDNIYSLTYFYKNSRDRWLFKNPLFLNDIELINHDKYKILKIKVKANLIFIGVILNNQAEEYNLVDSENNSYEKYRTDLVDYYLIIVDNYSDNYYISINNEKIKV